MHPETLQKMTDTGIWMTLAQVLVHRIIFKQQSGKVKLQLNKLILYSSCKGVP
jgi:hypothetical protein